MPDYRFLACDLLTGTVREEIPFQSVHFGEVLNAPGSFSASTPISIVDSNGYNPINNDVLAPGRTMIAVERDNIIVWTGILWTVRANLADQTVDYGGEGLWSYFRRRLINTTQTFANTDQADIARSLLTYAQSVPGGTINLQLGADTTGRLRDRTYYGYEHKPIGEAIEQLAAVIDGFDFSVTSDWNGNTIASTFNIHYPKRGTRTDYVLDIDNQITSLELSIDATKQATQVTALGAGDGDAQLVATITDTALFDAYPLTEDLISLIDISILDTLEGHARTRLAAERLPISTISNLTFRPAGDLTVGSFVAGDEIRVVSNAGYINLDAYYRCIEWNVDIYDTGTESLNLVFADPAAFPEDTP